MGLLLLIVSCVADAGVVASPTESGVELRIGADQSLELRLVEVQRGDARLAVGEGRTREAAGRLEIHRPGSPVVEWYVRDPRGVEQGLDVARAPLEGAAPLRFAFETRGGLVPLVENDGATARFFDAKGQVRLELGKLVAWDAAKRPLPARMGRADAHLVYEVDDRGATYPIVVDPLATTPGFEFVGSATLPFESSIATAGDVNGDGYSDLVASADDGYAYLFLGSTSGLAATPVWRAALGSTPTRRAVASAGDVNGDGYADMLFAAREGGAQVNSGVVRLWLGSAGIAAQPDGTPANADWSADSLQADAAIVTGRSVNANTAGDLNGDGYADVVIGWPWYDGPAGDVGTVHVWLGSSDFASRPNGTPANSDWRADGSVHSTAFGTSVSTAGDVNGDGFDDLVVGAPDANDALVWLGASGFATEANGTIANADWRFATTPAHGTPGAGQAGETVANAGDVDGDGYADVLIGRWLIPPTYRGQVLLYRGHPTTVLEPTPFHIFNAPYPPWMAAATAGDVNGDGLADIVLGNGTNTPHINGEVRVHFGRRGAAPNPTPARIWTGGPGNQYFGRAVATAGDVNGDGFSDVAAMGNVAHVFHGGGYGLTATHDLLYGGSGGGSGATLIAGIGVGMAGDINGDGYGDYVVGMAGADEPGLVDAGRFEVDYGGSCGPACGPNYLGGQGNYEGEQAGEMLGWSVAGAGDVNNDGYADVIAGAPEYDATVLGTTYTNSGRARVYYGNFTGLTESIWTELDGPQSSTGRFGAVVASAGDVNGDGFRDVVVGAPDADGGGHTDNGSVSVYLGSASGISTTPSWTQRGTSNAAHFGASVASAGDVNRDGFSDLIVGTAVHDVQVSGRAYVYLGSAAGLAETPVWTGYSGDPIDEYGLSVASAGDLNRDGYADIVVGDPQGLLGYGSAFVYHGSPTGPSTTPNRVLVGEQGQDRFGGGVASAGDVDGDGYSDLIIGSHWYAGPQGPYQGRASVYTGGPTGIDPARVQHLSDCASAPCDFGRDVAGAGDLNGDGFSDVLIGAFSLTNPSFGDGGVFVHFGNEGTGWNRSLRQWNGFGVPVDLLGSVGDTGQVRPAMVLRSAAGRSRVSLESELELLGTPFDGLGTVLSFAPWDTGVAGILVSNGHPCGLNQACRWRARVRSANPFFPRTRWLSPQGNGPEETDARGPVAPDQDADGVADALDNCPDLANAGQEDLDFDAVGNLCDNCTTRANPRLDLESYLRTNPWATVTGGQRDDDHDGYGNRCDAKFTPGVLVGVTDLVQFRASNGKNRTLDVCGTLGTRPCAIFDLDETGLLISATDLVVFRVLNGKLPGPKCATCPRPCQNGAMGSCLP